MYLCYVDESGTPEVPGVSQHYVLAGIAIPVWHWKTCESELDKVRQKYALSDAEIHTAWLLRRYVEQEKIPNFEGKDYVERRNLVSQERTRRILNAQRGAPRKLAQIKKNYRKTKNYIHLTLDERKQFVNEVANVVGNWGFARMFAECIDKVIYSAKPRPITVDEQGFEQVISRFEAYLANLKPDADGNRSYGIVIHDNNDTVAEKLTNLMKRFHAKGTLFRDLKYTVETPLFVNSELTSLVQVADLCSYALRRYLEYQEEDLLNRIFDRAHRSHAGVAVGIRHYTDPACRCLICDAHKQ